MIDLNIVLLHADMVDKQNNHVTTSLTMIDLHDIARSAKTFGVNNLFISHPAPTIRNLANTLRQHWDVGFGSTYNPNRKEALEHVSIVTSLDDAINIIDQRSGKLPILVATSAKPGGDRISFTNFKEKLEDGQPYLIMLGTGWGMSDELLGRAQLFLDPINGPEDYNHLSVRSACAIILDRLRGS